MCGSLQDCLSVYKVRIKVAGDGEFMKCDC